MSNAPATPDSQLPPPQQWHMIASPGHILLAQVDSYRTKTRAPQIAAIVAVALVYVVLALHPVLSKVSNAAGSAAGWVVYHVSKVAGPSAPAISFAPVVQVSKWPLLHNPYSLGVPQSLTPSVKTVTQIQAEMGQLREQMQAGQKIAACSPGQKITAPWAMPGDYGAHCKYSSDGKRLWIWTLANANTFGGYTPGWYLSVIRKDADRATAYEVTAPGLLQMPGAASVPATSIPRAIANDFPELK